jgi:diguanylate cyclase (GGDEF)-like protein
MCFLYFLWETILQRISGFYRARLGSVQTALEQTIWTVCVYAIPLLLFVISIFAIFYWDDMYAASPAKQIALHVFPESGSPLSVADAQLQLAGTPDRKQYETNLSEVPVWFSFKIPTISDAVAAVELPSRHVVSMNCWDAASQVSLGQINNGDPAGALVRSKAGYAFKPDQPDQHVICKAFFQGPAKLTAYLWSAEQLEISVQDFHRKSGLLDGGMMILAIFVLITALINRQGLYVVFAAWLIVTLRISATSGGWDTQWLNHEVPQVWLAQGRSVTRAVWALLTVTLFKALFREDLKKLRSAVLVTIAEWLCLALLLAALVLPRGLFLVAMWSIGSAALLIAMVSLVNIVIKTRSLVALWYAASMTVTLMSGISEIFAAAFGFKQLVGTLNTVTAALASSLLAALAIAEQMRQTHVQKVEAQAELQHTYEAIPIGLFTLDLQGRFMSANPALHKILGRHVLRIGRNSWQQYFSDGAWLQLYQIVHHEHGGELELQGTGTSPQGMTRRYLVKATLARDKIEGSLQDVTEKSLATEKLNFLANHDSLTKVLNRRGIEEVFNSAVAQCDAVHPMALAYLDLDRFKLINDLYGHNSGDDVLRQVCERITALLSGGMRVGRVGGDEFVVVLPNTRMQLATVICRGIVDSIDNTPYRVGEKSFHVRGSIGLIEIGQGTLMKEALSTADRACREAKSGQHKGLVVYEMDAPAFKEHEAEIRLIESLSNSETIEGLFVEMQPIMSLTRPKSSLNFEVLLRMRDKLGKLIPVSRVIAAGEHSGRMSVIDRWVLATTLAWLNQNLDRLQNTQFVCMNLSGASWNDEEFMEGVCTLLRSNSHVVKFLSIEITESVALHDLQNTRRFIEMVRGLGARVALDDFGAGYTSFAYLKDLPADLLKIDGSFVVNMNQHPANVSIVEAIVNLAKNLGMKTIAEWAEDTATVQTLAEIGVDYVQGYVVARPMAPEKLIAAISAASFIKDEELLKFVSLIEQANDPMTQIDLIHQDNPAIPRKIH